MYSAPKGPILLFSSSSSLSRTMTLNRRVIMIWIYGVSLEEHIDPVLLEDSLEDHIDPVLMEDSMEDHIDPVLWRIH